MDRKKVLLICDECLSRNYTQFKSPASTSRIEIKKHCKHCNKHTLHKESR